MHLRVSIAMVTHSYLSEIRCIHICEHCVSLELILMCELSHVSALVLIYVWALWLSHMCQHCVSQVQCDAVCVAVCVAVCCRTHVRQHSDSQVQCDAVCVAMCVAVCCRTHVHQHSVSQVQCVAVCCSSRCSVKQNSCASALCLTGTHSSVRAYTCVSNETASQLWAPCLTWTHACVYAWICVSTVSHMCAHCKCKHFVSYIYHIWEKTGNVSI